MSFTIGTLPIVSGQDTSQKVPVSNTGNSNAATLDGSGNLAITGDIQLANNKHVQWKSTVDSLYKNALYLDAAKQFNIQAIPTIELINLKKSDGTTKFILDAINNILTMNGAMNLNPTGLVDNGSTSGTATLWQLLVGNVKMVFIDQSNFRNAGGAITRALPTAFTHGGLIVALNCADFALLKTAVAVSVNSIISFNATTGAASIVSVTTISGSSISGGGGTTGWDSVQYTGGNTIAHNGGIFIIGV